MMLKQCRCGGAQIESEEGLGPVLCGEPACEIPKRVAYSEEIRKGHMIILNAEMDRPSVTTSRAGTLKER
jgi:hypothetical protein